MYPKRLELNNKDWKLALAVKDEKESSVQIWFTKEDGTNIPIVKIDNGGVTIEDQDNMYHLPPNMFKILKEMNAQHVNQRGLHSNIPFVNAQQMLNIAEELKIEVGKAPYALFQKEESTDAEGISK